MEPMITSRAQVTQIIIARKVQNNLRWSQLADLVGKSKEWVTAACLGQMPFSKREAEIVGEYFKLTEEQVAWLQIVPHKSAPGVPADPCLYRLYEALGVYGPALKELIHEEFGDGIMSAINFTIKLEREPNPEGDRVKMTWSGKFLPYKSF